MFEEIKKNVKQALAEDIGTGDLTALLVPEQQMLMAEIVTREDAVLCGAQWFELCFQSVSPDVRIQWFAHDGERLAAQQTICRITGNARSLLTAERSALNFLQLLSAVATQTRRYVDAIADTQAVIVDTRKTLPGLRLAQKYAVKCGGGENHRLGLYDGVLIKENHIAAAGGIARVLEKARAIVPRDVFIQIEVESLEELQTALDAGATMVLLDNFTQDQLNEAVALRSSHAKKTGQRIVLEASGNVRFGTVRSIAETGVDRISIGSLTKNVQAIDLSMRFA